MAGIAVTRKELSAAELRSAAGKTRDARAARRMLAIAPVLEGMDRETAARTCGMERQTLRGEEDQETVRGTVSPTNGHRYNAEGLSGLVNLRGAQRPRRLTPEQMTMLAAWVEAGPDAAKDGVVRWRRRDLQARIAAEFGVTLHERTVGKQLAALGFRRLSVRPQHPKSDPEAQTAFKKTSPRR
jgi:transposase